jgi:hypothetical protein
MRRYGLLLVVVVGLLLVIGPALAQNSPGGEREFTLGEIYRRTGHPGAASFYYKLVLTRFPGSVYATKALQRLTELPARP